MNAKQPENFTNADVEIIEKVPAYHGFFRINRYILRHRLFAGGWSTPLKREVFDRGHAAAALLFDPVRNKIVMVEQFRVGVLEHTDQPWLLELVAGARAKGEMPDELIIREAQEEAGLKVLDLFPIYEYWVSPGANSEKVTLFCARVDASQAGGIHGLPDEGEDIRVHVFDVQEVYAMLAAGKINNAMSIIAVQWFQLHEAEVRRRWNS